jgi:hypothetical protein
MFVFGRALELHPAHVKEAAAASVQLADRVTEVTGRITTAWMAIMSPREFIRLTTVLENLDEYEAFLAALSTDAQFDRLVAEGASYFTGTAEGEALQPLDDFLPPGMPNYTVSTDASVSNGHFRAGYEAAVEFAQLVRTHAGLDTMVLGRWSGPYTGVAWWTSVQTLGEFEAGRAKLNASPEWQEAADRLGVHFDPGTTATIYRRLG